MSKVVAFCSTQRVPNDEFTEEMLRAIAGLAYLQAKGYQLKSKSSWKSLLNDPEVGQIVLLGVEDPAEYEVPLEDLVDISTVAGRYVIPTKCQIINRTVVLVVPPASSFQSVGVSEPASI
jgi:hypothetical protein